jgi:hypothetical protein
LLGGRVCIEEFVQNFIVDYGLADDVFGLLSVDLLVKDVVRVDDDVGFDLTEPMASGHLDLHPVLKILLLQGFAQGGYDF